MSYGNGNGGLMDLPQTGPTGNPDPVELQEPEEVLFDVAEPEGGYAVELGDEDPRIRITLHSDRPLGVGYVGRFLESCDVVFMHMQPDEALPAEIERVATGSIIITITLTGAAIGGAAKAGWSVYKYFHKIYIEKKRRDEQWRHEAEVRLEQQRREDALRAAQQNREDALRAEQWRREDDIRREEKAEALAALQTLSSGPRPQPIDPRVKNIVIEAGGEVIDFNKLIENQIPI